MDLVLIGLRASGKSTLGRQLADAGGLTFVDLDDVVLAGAGDASIGDLFAREGEPAFRTRETAALLEVLADEPARTAGDRVIALGGGTPTAPGAREMLERARNRGEIVIVYLRGRPEVLGERLAGGKAGANRPGLRGKDPAAEVAEIFAERDPPYQQLANRVIEGIELGERGVAAMRDWRDWAQDP